MGCTALICGCFSRSVSVLITAFVGTAVAFGCFSVAAMLARRREYLYLGGLLSSGLSILLWLHFASSIFGGSAALFKFEVRVSLAMKFFMIVFYSSCLAAFVCLILTACYSGLDNVHSCTLGFWCLWAMW